MKEVFYSLKYLLLNTFEMQKNYAKYFLRSLPHLTFAFKNCTEILLRSSAL